MPKFVDYGDRAPRVRSRTAGPLDVLSGGLVVAAAYVYLAEPDWAYALTMWPCWVVLGPLALVNMVRRGQGRWSPPRLIASVAACLAVGLSDTPMQLLRWQPTPGDITVVSLNCAGGSDDAMRELIAFKPNIVLLQERPGADEVTQMGRELFGQGAIVVLGPDAAIVTRGKLVASNDSRDPANINQAWATLEFEGRKNGVCSLRLTPPILRFDILHPDAWRACAAHKRARTQELEALVASFPKSGAGIPVILGGDMNTPPDRVTQASLSSRLGLRDTFWDAGMVWGGTAVNEYPFIRIDQIWQRGFVPKSTDARTTKYSDHRMVVAELSR